MTIEEKTIVDLGLQVKIVQEIMQSMSELDYFLKMGVAQGLVLNYLYELEMSETLAIEAIDIIASDLKRSIRLNWTKGGSC